MRKLFITEIGCRLILLCLFALSCILQAQEVEQQRRAVLNAQYAGSIGLFSIGYFKPLAAEKLELGLLYGHTPKRFGGPLHSFTLKFLYSPWRIKAGERFLLEPFQPGLFVAQHFGNNLAMRWPRDQYPRQYYWWPRSLRTHIFVSAALSIRSASRSFQRFSAYLEANTNDLYVSSYAGKKNYRSLTLYDIIFFGCGVKAYLR